MLKVTDLTREFSTAEETVTAVDQVSCELAEGVFASVVGKSGSGKSTLLSLLGALDKPTSGTIAVDGVDVTAMNDAELTQYRRNAIGFVFQSYNLLPRTSALENVSAPLMYQGVGRRERHARAQATLERLGLGDRLDHEPTGNLDSHSGAEVIALFHDLHASGRTIILITHDPEVAAVADRQVHIRDGRIAA